MGKPLVETNTNTNKYMGTQKKIQKKKKDIPLDLETNREEDMENMKLKSQKIVVQKRQNIYDREEDEEIEEDYNIEDAKNKSGNQDKISDIIVGLLLKNKINSKNAFDVPVMNVLDLSDFKNINSDFAWKRLSSTLDAGAKVYGYRVDQLHSDTYRIRGGLHRSETNETKDQKNNENEQPEDEEIEKKNLKKKFKGGESTLEKNLANINAAKYDLEFDVDPLFQKTSAKFDDQGAKGLLMNTLGIDSDVSILLDSSKQQQLWKKRKQRKATYGDIASLNCLQNYDSLFTCQLCPEMTNLALDMRTNSKSIFDVSRIRENRKNNFLVSTNSEMRMQTALMDEIIEGERDIMNEIGAAILNVNDDYIDPLEREQLYLTENPTSFRNGGMNNNLITIDPQGYDDYNDQLIPDQDEIQIEREIGDYRNDKEANNNNLEKFTSFDEEHNTTQTQTAILGVYPHQQLKPLNFLNIDDKIQMIGFGKDHLNGKTGRNWMQPDAWNLPKKQNIKNVIKLSDLLPELNIFRSKKNKQKDECEIDFDLDIEEDFNSVIQPENNKFKSSYAKEIGMLPKDFHIQKQLFSSFALKDPSTIYHRQRFNSEDEDDNTNNDAIDFYDYHDDNRIQPNNPHIHSVMSKVLNEIAEKQAVKAKNQIPIKELKTKLWDKLEEQIPMTMKAEENTKDSFKMQKRVEIEEEEICFSDVYDKLPGMIGLQDHTRVSLQTCFVTILHLANEKTLRFLRTNQEGDFTISRDQI